MFHLNYPRFRGFFAWDELGCLSRALGFPVGLFKNNLTDEIYTEDNGLSLQETVKVLDYKLLYKALHATQNLHTADWNSCVLRRCVAFLEHRALKYEDINNARVAYQAYEAGDMKGMLLSEHILMRALKMCNKTISPMKLMHRIKHSQNMYDEPGRIQLYEFLDILLWADGYKGYIPEATYAHFEMKDDLFKLKKHSVSGIRRTTMLVDTYEQRIPTNLSLGVNNQLTDFDSLMSHHDGRVAKNLDTQYLKEEWEFPEVKIKDNPKFKDTAVVCGDSRVEMTRLQKQSYRHLRCEVGRSQKSVHCVKGGFVRERPVTAPNLSMYNQLDVEEYKRRQSMRAQSAISNRIQQLLRQAYNKPTYRHIEPVDMSDRPVLEKYKMNHTPKVVTDTDVQETVERLQQLLFDIETEEGRYEIAMDTEIDTYIPKYRKRKEEIENKTNKVAAPHMRKRCVSPSLNVNRYDDAINSLAYPIPKLPPSHARKCDAREKLDRLQHMFRGWYCTRSKKGAHYILMSPFFHDSPKGQLFRKLSKMSDAQIKQIHGDFLYRKTKTQQLDRRPVTAPEVMTMAEYQSKMASKGNNSKQSKVSSGYGRMEENVDKEHSEPTSELSAEVKHDYSNGKSDADDERSKSHSKSDSETISESKDSVDTSLSDSIQLPANEKEVIIGGRPRATSAYVHRKEQLQSSRDALYLKGEEGRQPRSKSAADVGHIPVIDDVTPIPHMDHSKPKIVSVGSIGKISLLESISEAQFWEDLALKQQKERMKQLAGTADTPNSVHSEACCAGDVAADNIYVEENICCSKKKKGKGKSHENFEDVDVLSFLLQEEKMHKRNLRSNKKNVSSRKSWSTTSPSQASGISCSNSGGADAIVLKPGENLQEQCENQNKSVMQNTIKVNSAAAEENVNNVHRHVVVQAHNETISTNIKPHVGKYDRLLKRLGDDMSPHMKKLMQKVY